MELVTRIPSILTILNSKYPRACLWVSTRGLPKTKGIPNRKRRLLARIPDCSDEASLTEIGHFKQAAWHVLRDQWQNPAHSCFLAQYFCFLGEACCAVCRNITLSSLPLRTTEQQEELVAPKLHVTNSTWQDREVIPLLLCFPEYQHKLKHPELHIYSKWR